MKFLLYVFVFSLFMVYFFQNRGWLEITPAGKQVFRNVLSAVVDYSEKLVALALELLEALKARFFK